MGLVDEVSKYDNSHITKNTYEICRFEDQRGSFIIQGRSFDDTNGPLISSLVTAAALVPTAPENASAAWRIVYRPNYFTACPRSPERWISHHRAAIPYPPVPSAVLIDHPHRCTGLDDRLKRHRNPTNRSLTT